MNKLYSKSSMKNGWHKSKSLNDMQTNTTAAPLKSIMNLIWYTYRYILHFIILAIFAEACNEFAVPNITS